MSLISHAIEAMGSQSGAPAPARLASSIGMWSLVKDWWGVPLALRKPTEKAVGTPQYTAARRQNMKIEYALFRAVLSPEIHIFPVEEDAAELVLPEGCETDAAAPKIGARFIDTPLPSAAVAGARFIHEFEVTNASNTSVPRRHIVLVHGYMAAMGYFLKNVEAIARSYPNLVVHVIDMPGFGNSARPEFPSALLRLPGGASRADEIAQIIGVENWFIDQLEEWRREKNLVHFGLVGHSMGAYICSCYLLKYNRPDARIVDRFILVSPMGTESSDISLINNRKLQFNHHDVASDPLQEIFASQDFEHEDNKEDDWFHLWERLGKPRFPRNAVLKALWNNNISPFQLLQTFGPFYSKLLSFWSFQRFQNLSANFVEPAADEKPGGAKPQNADLILKLHEYSFSIFNQYQASGELAITKLINHEIVPRIPLCDRGFVEYLNDAKIKTLWMYGDRDWMNSKGGEYCVEKLRGLSDPDADLVVLKNAGHHLYLDNPEEFNNAVIGFFEPRPC
ncbi:alpha/beta-hydrolase [Metschnikowia bicuspidata var. bicuspidata NRRL YB-4993]|uniref:Alpha/beta-hydrolase n=1 Tax=Metschnikowia bicuspidata var. bicuspidata NRRL YB-4993 TaxID=869754 RepID=A0A1A0H993_9ASCO|nr:alpha/beta-hydrolase [Metschnikowia bicuspidata var. bicuspidata NRRL YB-4993]OBA20457.1 alpha/beta-hydrolase [Metschnikowia bicuspidata var. bicuspidata NRRL YB-4993]